MKKFLLIGGILGLMVLIVLGVTMCGVMKVANDWVKEKEPELRQYVQMTEVEQNDYVEKHMDELFRRVEEYAEGHRENAPKDQREKWAEFEKDPEAKAAAIQLGRSIVAALIMASEPITAELSADDKAKYENEANDTEQRTEAYTKFMKKYGLAD